MSAAAALRWCSYCRSNRPAEGFVDVYETSRAKRRKCNSKCARCSQLKKLSVAERDRRGSRVREEQRAAAKRKLEETIRRRSEPTV